MTISAAAYLQTFHNAANAAGAKAISSDFSIEIVGYESSWILTKKAPWPVLSPGGEIEVPMPLGSLAYQGQQVKVAKQGEIEMYETVAGSIDQLLVNLIVGGGKFDAKLYEGTPQAYLHYKEIFDCFIVIDSDPSRDWENRSQVMTISGTMFYHYFGDITQGNSTNYA